MSHARTAPAARALGAVAIVAAALLFTACQPEPAATPSAEPEPTTSLSPRPPGPSPTPIETQAPDVAFAVPATCEEIYSATMLGRLEVENPPLNHPDVTMLSTQNVDLLEIIGGGAATIRCSWGTPSEFGLATNVTVVDDEQAEAIEAELMVSGHACQPLGEGTICRIDQKGVTLDDEEYASGETHFVGGGGWVSTAWINFAPEGYTEDIVDTLWG
jgi:hypothetical protein